MFGGPSDDYLEWDTTDGGLRIQATARWVEYDTITSDPTNANTYYNGLEIAGSSDLTIRLSSVDGAHQQKQR